MIINYKHIYIYIALQYLDLNKITNLIRPWPTSVMIASSISPDGHCTLAFNLP